MLLIISGCATKADISTDEATPSEDINNKYNEKLQDENIEPSNPFYPLKQSIYDMQNQINNLKSKIIEYESKLHNPSFDTELLNLIKLPELKHELIMTNGTIIQGTIISENTDAIIVQTQIGQLTIEKVLITEIKEIDPLAANIIFVDDEIEARQVDNIYTYIGKVKNTGGLRADFVRVIYHFWADDTSPVISDSTFVSGSSIFYLNGVISDSAIEPTEFGTFEISINIPDSLNVEYHTKEPNWDIFK